MRHNGRTKNFRLPIYNQFPPPDSGELTIIEGNPDNVDGLYVYQNDKWNLVTSQIANTGTKKAYFGRRSSNLSVSGSSWLTIPINVDAYTSSSFTHAANSSEVVINRSGLYSVVCEVSAQRNSGSSSQFALALASRSQFGSFSKINGSYGYGSCDNFSISTSHLTSSAILELSAGSAIRAETVIQAGSGSISLISQSFRFIVEEL
jgi:hypothetical protein